MLPFLTLLESPAYILWKVPVYLKVLGSREKAWARTDRRRVERMRPA